MNIEDKIFFVMGNPKSGTTWVQMLLNSHTNISCRPEDQFRYFTNGFSILLNNYNDIIKKLNKRTANQSLTYYDDNDILKIFKFAVSNGLNKGFQTPGTERIGTKDNSIIDQFNLYTSLFPMAKFIFVLRDPRDIAVSSWFHNLRVEENFLQRAHTIELWALKTAKWWNETTKTVMEESQGMGSRFLQIRYEDLHLSPIETVTRLLSFLSVSCSSEIAQSCLAKTTFSNFTNGRKPGTEDRSSFFRKGVVGDWKNYLDGTTEFSMNAVAGALMRRFQYL